MTLSTDLTPDDFETLDAMLDDMRSRDPEVPQWEFVEGFLAAVVCCRETLSTAEAIDTLLPEFADETPLWADGAQKAQFLALCERRRQALAVSLATKIESLADEAAFSPEVMDVRGAIACLSPEDRAQWEAEQTANPDAPEELPSFAQIWALGFMAAVEFWPEAWEAPRDREVAQWLSDSLEHIVALTEDDTHAPTENMYEEGGPPSVSQERLNAFGEALWAVYDIHQIWKSLGPRTGTVIKAPEPGRNDLCPCGSGKKYKKCCGQ